MYIPNKPLQLLFGLVALSLPALALAGTGMARPDVGDEIPDTTTAADTAAAHAYALNFDRDADRTYAARTLASVALGSQTVSNPHPAKMYQDLTAFAFSAKAGETVQPTFNYSQRWMHGYVYLDKGSDGQYSASVNEDGTLPDTTDLVAYSYYTQSSAGEGAGYNSAGDVLSGSAINVLNPPAFTLPDLPDGFYMMRYKVDWDCIDPAGSTVENNDIVRNGGDILDVRLRIYSGDDVPVSVRVNAEGGELYTLDGDPLDGSTAILGQDLKFRLQADETYSLHSIHVLHGVLTGDSLVGGIAQRATAEVALAADADGIYTLPASVVDGDMVLTVIFDRLVFSDEFNQPGNIVPDSTKWSSSKRTNATWARFITDSRDVAFVQDSVLVLRCFVNPNTTGSSDLMLSGAQETQNKYSFLYGRVEARLKTNLHTGNFPAFWLMPQPPTEGWPSGGEIDIFESINSENRSYHTVHSHWTYDLGRRSEPTSSGNRSLDVTQWHVYGLEWEPDQLRWYIDGEQVFSYSKSTDANALSNGQWPFDHPFYIILNQSVGNGSWASAPDTSYVYETQVDWVRVYQTESAPTAIQQAPTTGVVATAGVTFDLQGRRVARPGKGLYIVDGRKVLVR